MPNIINCKKCLHKWTSRVPNPVQCPKCKSTSYFKDKVVHTPVTLESVTLPGEIWKETPDFTNGDILLSSKKRAWSKSKHAIISVDGNDYIHAFSQSGGKITLSLTDMYFCYFF